MQIFFRIFILPNIYYQFYKRSTHYSCGHLGAGVASPDHFLCWMWLTLCLDKIIDFLETKISNVQFSCWVLYFAATSVVLHEYKPVN